MSYPFASVVIVTYNNRNDIEECLRSVLDQEYPDFEVIVVDNDSTDDTVKLVREKFPLIKVVENNKNYGAAKGYNIGVNASEGGYVALLNPDTVVERDWLSELVRVMEENKDIGACQSRILLYDKPDTINTEGNEVNYLGFTWCRNYGKKNSDDKQIQETIGLSVCSAILRRDVLEEVGFFDEDFFMYLDDTDLGLRVYLMGYKIVCNPKSIVYHKYKFRVEKKKFYYLERNRLMLLIKNYPPMWLLKILPTFAFMEVGLVLLSLFQGWLKEKMLSYAWILRNWRAIKSRKTIMHWEGDNERKIFEMMSPTITFEEIQNPILMKVVNPFLRAYYRLVVCR
jgi:GT2 family glycosyltransferase